MHENTTSSTDPKVGRQIPYRDNHKFRKFHPKLIEVHQSLSNVGEDIIICMYHYKGSNTPKNRLTESYNKRTEKLFGIVSH